ncbi:unnamed protein product [Danaus chrysippus]|uniref:(African queen) hypothetical protein n=1 Tax=Danaus chrysippus TaxID=151541 RepID=A0A8J2WDF0_9NEOP|nr:unnamed protein product [Danaus chrysippus]
MDANLITLTALMADRVSSPGANGTWLASESSSESGSVSCEGDLVKQSASLTLTIAVKSIASLEPVIKCGGLHAWHREARARRPACSY